MDIRLLCPCYTLGGKLWFEWTVVSAAHAIYASSIREMIQSRSLRFPPHAEVPCYESQNTILALMAAGF